MVGGAEDNECSYTDFVAVELHKLHNTLLLEVARMVKLATRFRLHNEAELVPIVQIV